MRLVLNEKKKIKNTIKIHDSMCDDLLCLFDYAWESQDDESEEKGKSIRMFLMMTLKHIENYRCKRCINLHNVFDFEYKILTLHVKNCPTMNTFKCFEWSTLID